MSVTPAGTYVTLSPAGKGEDVLIALSGTESAAGWTLAVYASYTPAGPASVSGLTVTYTGGSDYVISVTVPAAVTSAVVVPDGVERKNLYVEVWRTDTGDTRVLRRLILPVYDPLN